MTVLVDLGGGQTAKFSNALDVGMDSLGNLHITTEDGGSIYRHTTWLSVECTEANDRSEDQ